MINLILKDFILAKKINMFILLYIIFISFVGLTKSHISAMFYVMTLTMFVYIAMIYINGYDTKNNSEVFINSLPIRKSDVVKSKYLEVFILLVFFGLLMIVLTSIIIGLNPSFVPKSARAVNGLDIIMSSIFVSFFYSIYYPIYFKFGGERLRVFNGIIFVVIIASPSIIVKFSKKYVGQATVKWLQALDSKGLVILLWGICIMFFIASMFLSQWIYERRDIF